VLDKAAGGSTGANYLFLGDLNTMGMNHPFGHWWNSSHRRPHSDLDHVVSAEHLRLKAFNGAEVRVLGWPQEPTDAAKDRWAGRYSDHALLYLEVQRV